MSRLATMLFTVTGLAERMRTRLPFCEFRIQVQNRFLVVSSHRFPIEHREIVIFVLSRIVGISLNDTGEGLLVLLVVVGIDFLSNTRTPQVHRTGNHIVLHTTSTRPSKTFQISTPRHSLPILLFQTMHHVTVIFLRRSTIQRHIPPSI